MSAAALIDRLERVTQTGPGTWRARCPAHECRSQTLSIRETDDGRVLVHDFGGCAAVDVIAAVGLQMTDLFPARLPEHRYAPSRSAFPAREALALIDYEVMVALLIVDDTPGGSLTMR